MSFFYYIFYASLIIVISLGIYLIFLIIKVRNNKRQYIQKRVKRCVESIVYIEQLVVTNQLDLAEAAIRTNAIVKPLGISLAVYPALNNIYQVVANHAIADQIKELDKETAKKQKFDRIKVQAEYSEDAIKELTQLVAYLKTQYKNYL